MRGRKAGRTSARIATASAAVLASSLILASPAPAHPSLNCAAGGRGGSGGHGGISVGGSGGLAFTVGGLGGSTGFADASGGDAGSARGGRGGRGGSGTLPICNQNTNGRVFYEDDYDDDHRVVDRRRPVYIEDGPVYVDDGPVYVDDGPVYVDDGPVYIVDDDD